MILPNDWIDGASGGADRSSSTGVLGSIYGTFYVNEGGPGYDFSANPQASGAPAFTYQGSQYLVAHQVIGNTVLGTGDGKLHMFRITPSGLTQSITELDSANAPGGFSVGGADYVWAYAVCRDGTNVYVLRVRKHGVSPVIIDGMTLNIFDLSTGLWGSDIDFSSPTIDFVQSVQVQISLVLRGPGDMVLYYSGPKVSSHGRCYYATFDGAAFGTGTILPDQTGGNIAPIGAVCYKDGTTHFFESLFDEDHSVNGFPVKRVAMSSGESFGATELVTNQPYLPNIGHSSPPIIFMDSGRDYLALAILINDDSSFTTQSHRLYYALLSASTGTDALSWNNSIISQGVYESNDYHILLERDLVFEPQSINLQYMNGVLICSWMWSEDNSFLGYFYESHATFASLFWSSPEVLMSIQEDPIYSYYMPNDLFCWTDGISQVWFAGASVGDSGGIFGSDVMQVSYAVISSVARRPGHRRNFFLPGKFLRYRHTGSAPVTPSN